MPNARDYAAIASTISEIRQSPGPGLGSNSMIAEGIRVACLEIACKVSEYFANEDEQFNGERFIAACLNGGVINMPRGRGRPRKTDKSN